MKSNMYYFVIGAVVFAMASARFNSKSGVRVTPIALMITIGIPIIIIVVGLLVTRKK